MVPIRGCSRGSTTRVREVPIASGWPGQSSANALWLARPATNARQMAVDRPARNPTEPLLIRTHRLTDHDASPAFLTHAAGATCPAVRNSSRSLPQWFTGVKIVIFTGRDVNAALMT